MENKARQKAINLISLFMKPIDSLGKNPMCLTTAKQCVMIHLDQILDDKIISLKIKDLLFYKEVKKEMLKIR
jgi:hypothetical protein